MGERERGTAAELADGQQGRTTVYVRSLVSQGFLSLSSESDGEPAARARRTESKLSEEGENETDSLTSYGSSSGEESAKDEDESTESDSDEDSDSDSQAESEDTESIAVAEPSSHQRESRGQRTLEEKAMEFKVVGLPEFQEWANRAVFNQEMVPVPSLIYGIAQGEIALPLPQDRLAPPRVLKRAMTVKRSASLDREGLHQPLVGQKDKEGVLVSFMKLGDRHRRRRRTVARTPSMTSLTSIATVASASSFASATSISTARAGEILKGEAIIMRANKDVMRLLLNKLALTSKMRSVPEVVDVLGVPEESSGGRPRAQTMPSFREEADLVQPDEQPPIGASVSRVAQYKKDIGDEANKFDRSYARVRNTIEDFMTFRPLQRRHSICLGEREFRHTSRCRAVTASY